MSETPAPKPDGEQVVATGTASVAHSAPETTPAMQLLKMTPEDFKEALALYNPDEDPDVKVKRVKIDDLYDRATVHRTYESEGGKSDTKVSGSLAVQQARGPGMRQVPFSDWDQMNRIRASAEFRAQKLRETQGITIRGKRQLKEAYPDGFTLGSDVTTTYEKPNDEFHPLMLGPFNRNLYLYDFLDQASKAYEAFHHNPILKAAINTVVNFVMGEGIKIVAANPLCQAVWDRYVERMRQTGTPYSEKMRMMFRDACVIGEVFVTDPIVEGGRTMKMWDATTVWEIMTNARDIEEPYYAYRQFPTQWQLPYSKDGKVPQLGEYVIEQVTPDKWLQVKLNATVGEKRGRSDLFSVLGWGKRFKDWFDAACINGQISNAFVLWWQINGSPQDVDTIRNNPDFSKVPPPGSAWFTNAQVTPKLLRPEGGVSTGDKTGEQLLSIIAVSLNLPPEYFGVVGAATRADALVRGEPAQRFFAQRQQVVREVAAWQFRREMLRAQLTGELPRKQPKRAALRDVISALRAGDWDRAMDLTARVRGKEEYDEPLDISSEAILPNLVTEDRSQKLRDMAQTRATNVISQETYSTQAAKELGIENYDFDDEQAKIADEKARGIDPVSIMSLSRTGPGQQPKFGSPDSNQAYRRSNMGKPSPG